MSQIDDRQSTHGWPRIIAYALAVGAVIFTWRGIVWSTQDTVAGEYGRAALTLVACLVWIAGTVGVIHNGRRMRYVAWGSWAINLIAPLVFLWADDSVLARISPWANGGATYFYLPTIGAAVALAWLAWSSPSRIATRNGG